MKSNQTVSYTQYSSFRRRTNINIFPGIRSSTSAHLQIAMRAKMSRNKAEMTLKQSFVCVLMLAKEEVTKTLPGIHFDRVPKS